MFDYLFFDAISGEHFFVECDSYDEALDIASRYFYLSYIEYLGEYDPEEAEILGYDTY